ncbi:uncharacterized protein LOC131625511 [Vicia villosa]|uniref:uncharacterized protein LOC131625511 n=1 Tax=Vicia villosa TaxID=3911 RepID=UPI00273AD95D|nr:uncharacterized protein LOC131625511 [Vicia villosa]
MASTSSSASTQKSFLPPASPSSSASTEMSFSPPASPTSLPEEGSLRDPFVPEIKEPPRNYLSERVRKRKRTEEFQDKSLIHGFELQDHAAKFLESNDLSALREAIDEYVISNKETFKTVFKSFVRYYPNAFSFKLAKILELHPPLAVRTEIVALIHEVLPEGVNNPLSSSILIELKNPILQSLMLESEEILFRSLCESIGLLADRMYRTSVGVLAGKLSESTLGGWEELLEYCISCLSGDSGGSESENKKGLMLLSELPLDVAQNREFWLNRGSFELVFANILQSIYSTNEEVKGLAYNASISLMLFSKDLQRTDICDFLVPILLNIVDQHGEEEILLSRLKRLGDLVSLDDGNIFMRKHDVLFWCMIRVAEATDASEQLRSEAVYVIKELDTANVNVMECMIKTLSEYEVRRIFEVAMNMFSYVIDDPLWYDVDCKDCKGAGLTESYNRGQFLLDCLSIDGNESVFVPTAIGMITMKYLPSIDWQRRHAAMMAFATIAQNNFKDMNMTENFEQVIILVLQSLDEQNNRVLWATMHAIRRLSECKKLVLRDQFQMKFLEKLVPIIKFNSCARVQSYALIALRSLIKTCGFDKISHFGEQIITSLLLLLKHEKQKLQIEAVDTLKSFALLTAEIFRKNYYDTTIEALKVMAFNSLHKCVLCAKCLECMIHLIRKVGRDNFRELEVVQVVESLIVLESQSNNEDYLLKCIIIKVLDQICQCPRVSIGKFIKDIMPMLIGSIQPLLDLMDHKLPDDSLNDENKKLVELTRVRACNILSYCAIRSSIDFSPHISKVAPMFIRLVGCPNFQICKASILGLPKLLLSLKVGDKSNDTKRDITFVIVQSLIVKLKLGGDRDLSVTILRLVAGCIQISSSFFTDQLIRCIADGINDTVKKIIKFEIEKAQVGTLEDVFESLTTEELMEEVVHLIATTIDTSRDLFLVHVDDLVSNVVPCLADDKPDRIIAFAISIFNVILPLFPDKLTPYFDRYSSISRLALAKDYPCSMLYATRAVGICAMFGGDKFKDSAYVCISILYNVLDKKLGELVLLYNDGNMKTLWDTAVAAIGKICEFHCDCITPEVVQKWLSFLPLKHAYNEAKYAHGLLSKLIQRSDEHLFGSNKENLFNIISAVKGILSGPDRLGTEETINQLIYFIDQHGGMGIGTEGASGTKSS